MSQGSLMPCSYFCCSFIAPLIYLSYVKNLDISSSFFLIIIIWGMFFLLLIFSFLIITYNNFRRKLTVINSHPLLNVPPPFSLLSHLFLLLFLFLLWSFSVLLGRQVGMGQNNFLALWLQSSLSCHFFKVITTTKNDLTFTDSAASALFPCSFKLLFPFASIQMHLGFILPVVRLLLRGGPTRLQWELCGNLGFYWVLRIL